jgi:hypothetical protein
MSAVADPFVVFGILFAVVASQLLLKLLDSLSQIFVRLLCSWLDYFSLPSPPRFCYHASFKVHGLCRASIQNSACWFPDKLLRHLRVDSSFVILSDSEAVLLY